LGQQVASQGPDGNVAQTGYNSLSQIVVLTSSLGIATHYEYDALGRVITTTEPSGKITVNTFDAAGNLVRMTENPWPGQPQNYLQDYNLVTQYGYDSAGRQTIITSTLDYVSLTYYDALDRVIMRVANYTPTVPISTICTDFSNPDSNYNICSRITYDVAGRTISTTDSLGYIDRT